MLIRSGAAVVLDFKNMEKIMITGRLGYDATLRQHGNDECLNFTVAASRRSKQGDDVKEKTTWYHCALWRPSRVKDFLKKGQMVLVEGIPSCRNYKNREGELVAQMEITVTNVELLGKNPSDSAPATTTTAPAAYTTAPPSDPLGAALHDNPLEGESWEENQN